MRAAAVTTICCLFLGAGHAQVSRAPSLRPTPLEAFAARPAARVTWSKVIGRLESPESRATVTALVVADETGAPREMRGVRIDLAHAGATPNCD